MDALNKQHKLICLAIAAGGFIVCTALILFGLRLTAAVAMVVVITADIYYYVKTVKAPWNTKNTFSLIIILLIGIIPFGFITDQGSPRAFFPLVSGIVFIIAFFFINTSWQDTFLYKHVLKHTASPQKSKNFNTYRKSCIEEWYRSHPSGISNLSVLKITQRVVFAMAFISLGIYGIMTRKVSVFPNDYFFDIILSAEIIAFAFYYYLFGFRHCAFVAFVSWYALLIIYFAYRIALGLIPWLAPDIFGPAMGICFVALALVAGFRYAKRRILYSNVQAYEKNDKMVTVDLFLASIGTIDTLDTLFDITIAPSSNDYPEKFIKLVKYLIPAIRDSASVFCGYTSDHANNAVHIFVYASKNKSGRLLQKLYAIMQDCGYTVAFVKAHSDENWQYYKDNLYPNAKELCSITSRNYIERLFVNGVVLDKEYELKFLIYCHDGKDASLLEDELKYFGFKFYRITYEQDRNKLNPGYDYCAEFKVDTFITPRRLEYLNGIILKKTEDNDAMFLGEWRLSAN
jgi:hypothetical protein